MPIEIILELIAVGPLTLRGKLLLAIVAVATRNLERRDDAISRLEVVDGRSNGIHLSAEFVAQNVVLLHLENRTVIQVKIATADSGSGDFDDDIMVVDNLGFQRFD
jgi:hypothetical protein